MIRKNEKCFSPWFGYLVILVVCIVIATAIFFEFKGTRRHGRAHRRTVPAKAAVQVALPDEQGGIDTSPGKVLF
ncbi:MAG: hypothetical protein HQL17_02845 [Candidatus Omnitrophica bacterium]|nr:hypothetical protein [Candidatus Omnitrophota bacterium]